MKDVTSSRRLVQSKKAYQNPPSRSGDTQKQTGEHMEQSVLAGHDNSTSFTNLYWQCWLVEAGSADINVWSVHRDYEGKIRKLEGLWEG